MRRPLKKKHTLVPDRKYNSPKVAKLVNYVMLHGKKSTAQKQVYEALDTIGEDAVAVFDTAVSNVSPQMEVRSRRVGGANYQVPHPVRAERQLALSLRWIVGAARSKSGTSMGKRLADEIKAAAKNEGEAFKKKENTHKMAEANKAFAHFAWGRK
jgi:small subunit ribosomal protein S7